MRRNLLSLVHIRQEGHSIYNNFPLLKINDVSSFPTIPRKMKQYDSCILGKHEKQCFHDSHSKAHRNIEIILSNFCVPMHVPFENGNKYMMVVINYFTMWVEVYAIPNQEAATVTDVLIKEFICRFGDPQ